MGKLLKIVVNYNTMKVKFYADYYENEEYKIGNLISYKQFNNDNKMNTWVRKLLKGDFIELEEMVYGKINISVFETVIVEVEGLAENIFIED